MNHHIKTIWFRVIAWGLVLTVAAQEVSYAVVGAWFIPVRYGRPQGAALTYDISVPSDLGTIRETFRGSTDRFVIHLQDAHGNLSAQESLAGLVKYFHETYDVDLVLAEGGEGELEMNEARTFPDPAVRKKVARKFLRKWEITGPEFYVISENPDLKLAGSEKLSVYYKNRGQFLAVLAESRKLSGLRSEFNVAIRHIEDAVYSKKLRRFLKRTRLGVGADMRAEPTVRRANRPAPVNQAADRRSNNRRYRYTKRPTGARSRGVRPPDNVTGRHTTQQSPQGVGWPLHRILDRFYVKQEQTKNRLFQNPRERATNELANSAGLVNELLTLSVSRKALGQILAPGQELTARNFQTQFRALGFGRKWRAEFNKLFDLVPKAIDFYESTFERDQIMVERTVKEMARNHAESAILISGGFHTEGLTERWRARGISYVVIQPAMNKIDHDEMDEYRMATLDACKGRPPCRLDDVGRSGNDFPSANGQPQGAALTHSSSIILKSMMANDHSRYRNLLNAMIHEVLENHLFALPPHAAGFGAADAGEDQPPKEASVQRTVVTSFRRYRLRPIVASYASGMVFPEATIWQGSRPVRHPLYESETKLSGRTREEVDEQTAFEHSTDALRRREVILKMITYANQFRAKYAAIDRILASLFESTTVKVVKVPTVLFQLDYDSEKKEDYLYAVHYRVQDDTVYFPARLIDEAADEDIPILTFWLLYAASRNLRFQELIRSGKPVTDIAVRRALTVRFPISGPAMTAEGGLLKPGELGRWSTRIGEQFVKEGATVLEEATTIQERRIEKVEREFQENPPQDLKSRLVVYQTLEKAYARLSALYEIDGNRKNAGEAQAKRLEQAKLTQRDDRGHLPVEKQVQIVYTILRTQYLLGSDPALAHRFLQELESLLSGLPGPEAGVGFPRPLLEMGEQTFRHYLLSSHFFVIRETVYDLLNAQRFLPESVESLERYRWLRRKVADLFHRYRAELSEEGFVWTLFGTVRQRIDETLKEYRRRFLAGSEGETIVEVIRERIQKIIAHFQSEYAPPKTSPLTEETEGALDLDTLLDRLVLGETLSESETKQLEKLTLKDLRQKEWGVTKKNVARKIKRRIDLFQKTFPGFVQLKDSIFDVDEDRPEMLWSFYLTWAEWIYDQKMRKEKKEFRKSGRKSSALYVHYINGPLGVGKSASAEILALILRHMLSPVREEGVTMSLDDLYPGSDGRAKLRKKGFPHIGPPGTHDIESGINIITAFRRSNADSEVFLPRFLKEKGDLSEVPRVVKGKVGILILHGWMLGAELEIDPREIQGPFARKAARELKKYKALNDQADSLVVFSHPPKANIASLLRDETERLHNRVEATGGEWNGLDENEIEPIVEHLYEEAWEEGKTSPVPPDEKVNFYFDTGEERNITFIRRGGRADYSDALSVHPKGKRNRRQAHGFGGRPVNNILKLLDSHLRMTTWIEEKTGIDVSNEPLELFAGVLLEQTIILELGWYRDRFVRLWKKQSPQAAIEFLKNPEPYEKAEIAIESILGHALMDRLETHAGPLLKFVSGGIRKFLIADRDRSDPKVVNDWFEAFNMWRVNLEEVSGNAPGRIGITKVFALLESGMAPGAAVQFLEENKTVITVAESRRLLQSGIDLLDELTNSVMAIVEKVGIDGSQAKGHIANLALLLRAQLAFLDATLPKSDRQEFTADQLRDIFEQKIRETDFGWHFKEHVIWESEDNRNPLRGNQVLFLRMLGEIIKNAIEKRPADADWKIKVSFRSEKGNNIIRIRDFGPGIRPDMLEEVAGRQRILYYGESTKGKDGEKRGLGMAEAWHIAKLHGGMVEARNHPDGGAEFVITLPNANGTGFGSVGRLRQKVENEELRFNAAEVVGVGSTNRSISPTRASQAQMLQEKEKSSSNLLLWLLGSLVTPFFHGFESSTSSATIAKIPNIADPAHISGMRSGLVPENWLSTRTPTTNLPKSSNVLAMYSLRLLVKSNTDITPTLFVSQGRRIAQRIFLSQSKIDLLTNTHSAPAEADGTSGADVGPLLDDAKTLLIAGDHPDDAADAIVNLSPEKLAQILPDVTQVTVIWENRSEDAHRMAKVLAEKLGASRAVGLGGFKLLKKDLADTYAPGKIIYIGNEERFPVFLQPFRSEHESALAALVVWRWQSRAAFAKAA